MTGTTGMDWGTLGLGELRRRVRETKKMERTERVRI